MQLINIKVITSMFSMIETIRRQKIHWRRIPFFTVHFVLFSHRKNTEYSNAARVAWCMYVEVLCSLREQIERKKIFFDTLNLFLLDSINRERFIFLCINKLIESIFCNCIFFPRDLWNYRSTHDTSECITFNDFSMKMRIRPEKKWIIETVPTSIHFDFVINKFVCFETDNFRFRYPSWFIACILVIELEFGEVCIAFGHECVRYQSKI